MRSLFTLIFTFLGTSFLSSQSNYFVRFPDDIPIDRCTQQDLNTTGAPGYYNPNSLLLEASYEDEIFTVVRPYACIRIDRQWKVYNPATYNPAKPCIHIPNVPPANNPTLDPAQYPGMIVSSDTASAPWKASEVVLPGDTLPTVYSTFWSDTANCYIGTQYIYVIDTLSPVIKDTLYKVVTTQDTSANDPNFWRASYWTDPFNGLNDLEEGAVDLSIFAEDNFDCNGLQISYQLWLDLDGYGFQKTVIRPDQGNIPAGFVRYHNEQDPYNGGELRAFDVRNVALDQQYRFSLQEINTDTSHFAKVAWVNLSAPQDYVAPQLPPGYHKLIWEITDGCGNTRQDTVLLIIKGSHPLAEFAGVVVRFPDDVFANLCLNSVNAGAPILLNPFGLPIKMNYQDEILVGSTFCQSINRNWIIYNENTLDLQKLGVQVPNPTPNAIQIHPSNRPGPTVAPIDMPAPWAPSIVKVKPTDTGTTNFSTYWSATPNFYNYKQFLRLSDLVDPVISECAVDKQIAPDTTANSPLFWNAAGWLDHSSGSQDLPEVPVSLPITASDNCSGIDLIPNIQLLLDLDQDGTPETNYNIANANQAGTVLYNNLNGAGELRYFDQRPVPNNARYLFGIQSVVKDSSRIFDLCWYSTANPGERIPAQLPPGAHQIFWRVNDGCGNTATCNTAFTIPFDSTVSTLPALATSTFNLVARPNPLQDQTQISFYLPEPDQITLQVFDAQGKLVQTQSGYYPAGKQQIDLLVKGHSGIYYVVLNGIKAYGVGKLIKTN